MKKCVKRVCVVLCKNGISILAFHMLKILEDLKLVDQAKDRHAGEWETSLVLFTNKNLVSKLTIYKKSQDIGRYGVFGDPTKASEIKGKRYLKMAIGKIENDIWRLKPPLFFVIGRFMRVFLRE